MNYTHPPSRSLLPAGYDAWLASAPEGNQPDFQCSAADCGEATWDASDFKLCEVCGKRYCADHISRMDDLYLCETCCVCSLCGAPAVLQCDHCSDFVCSAHSREFTEHDPDTGYAEQGVRCLPRCKPITLTPADVVALAAEPAECPF